MGGEIWVESQTEAGSTFHFTARFGKQVNATAQRPLITEELESFRALVIDDNLAASEILSAMLTGFGLRVDRVSDGEAALQQLEQVSENDPYQLIITDWKMPKMDGVETIRHIHSNIQSNATADEIPTVIMVTAYGKEEAARAAKDVNINAFLTKPVTASSMLDTIMQVMGKTSPVSKRDNHRHDEAAQAISHLQGANILLVEDNEVNQELAADLLTSNGVKVTMAENGQVAIERLQQANLDAQQTNFDGVLMDCQMPVMDGYTATRYIREQLKLTELPILAMTANAMSGDKDKVLDAGMNDHIAKPINVNVMFQVMAKWITPANPDSGGTAISLSSDSTSRGIEGQEDSALRASIAALPGINSEKGLKQTQQNLSLYIKLLNKTAHNQAEFINQYQQALEQGDWQGAERLAHTLKGVSGSIGAQDLYLAATQLEKDAKVQQQIDAHWQQVCEYFTEMMQGLQQWLAAKDANKAEKTNAVDHAQVQQVQKVLATLMEQLAEFDTEVVDTLEKNRDLLKQVGHESDVIQLEKTVESYDFEAALHQLKQLQSEIDQQFTQGGDQGFAQEISAGVLSESNHVSSDQSASYDQAIADTALLVGVLDQLQQQLDEYDTGVSDTLEENLDLLHSLTEQKQAIDALCRAIDSYDFEAALGNVEQLKQAIQETLKE